MRKIEDKNRPEGQAGSKARTQIDRLMAFIKTAEKSHLAPVEPIPEPANHGRFATGRNAGRSRLHAVAGVGQPDGIGPGEKAALAEARRLAEALALQLLRDMPFVEWSNPHALVPGLGVDQVTVSAVAGQLRNVRGNAPCMPVWRADTRRPEGQQAPNAIISDELARFETPLALVAAARSGHLDKTVFEVTRQLLKGKATLRDMTAAGGWPRSMQDLQVVACLADLDDRVASVTAQLPPASGPSALAGRVEAILAGDAGAEGWTGRVAEILCENTPDLLDWVERKNGLTGKPVQTGALSIISPVARRLDMQVPAAGPGQRHPLSEPIRAGAQVAVLKSLFLDARLSDGTMLHGCLDRLAESLAMVPAFEGTAFPADALDAVHAGKRIATDLLRDRFVTGASRWTRRTGVDGDRFSLGANAGSVPHNS